MKHSTITDGAHPENGVTHGYIIDGNGKWAERDYGEEPTFCARVTAAFGAAWKNSGSTNRPYSVAHFSIAPGLTNQERFILCQDGKTQPLLLWGFHGSFMARAEINSSAIPVSQGGFISDYVWLPGNQIFYVLLCNTPKPFLI